MYLVENIKVVHERTQFGQEGLRVKKKVLLMKELKRGPFQKYHGRNIFGAKREKLPPNTVQPRIKGETRRKQFYSLNASILSTACINSKIKMSKFKG